MNKVSKLPDFIDVANIRDLFWNNNSDLYPSCVPTGYHRVEQIRPVFLTPYVGTCILDGELNHCIYNGEYYFLTKLEVLDIEKLRYKYQLDYDVMINFMVRGVDITGTLIKTNRPDILEGCLQTTVPILADPTQKRVYGKPKDTKETWQQKLKVDLFSVDTIRKNFEEWTITKENYQAFIHRIENNILGQGTKDKRWLADVDTGRFNEYAHQNPLFILDSLPIDRAFNKWKLLLAYDIAKFFEDTKKEDLIITKQVTPTDHFNHGGYVVGKKDNTIGQNIVSEYTLSRIDLSDLKDIVPVENTSKRDMEPNKKPTYDMLPHSQKIAPPPNICVLLRKPYLPIGSDSSIDGCIPSPEDWVKDYCEMGLLGGNNAPQKIVTQDNRTGYLWYLNKNNLALIEEEDRNLKSLGCKFSTSTWTGTYARWGFFAARYKNIAPLGFLIYQIHKSITEWDDIEHIGEGITTLFFRNGIRQSVINKRYVVDADKYWWGQADYQLLRLWGDSELSKVLLDLDQFNWLSIAPSDAGYTYKYHYGNYWNYKKFFPSAGGRQIGYPSMLNRMNIEFKGKEIICPYSYGEPDNSLPGWLGERERKLGSISIYDQIEIESGINKGDIVTTSLEHGWYNMDELTRLLFPYDISTAEWMEWSSRDYGGTINLGADEYSEFRSEQTKITAVGAVTVSIGILSILLAPFTGGGSLVIAAAAAPGIVALGSGAAVLASQPSYSTQFKSSVISTLPYSNSRYEVDPDLKDGTIVLYLYRGKYQVGIYKKKNISLSLADDDNLIKSVDGKTNSDLDLMLIRPLEHGLLDYKEAPVVSDTLKQEIIEVGLGNKDNLTPLDKTHHYSPDDLKVGTYTFDLRGTDWYLVVHNGTMNFVPKNASKVFDTIEDEGQLIDIKDDVSTFAKINQKADLNYYGQVFKLNTKFNFDDQFRYISKPIVPDKEFADPDVEYKWLLVKEPHDDIDELLTLPRKETRHAEVVDSSQVLMMKERLLQISTNYEQDKYANELMVGDKKLLMARQREDLNWMHTSTGLNIGLKGFGAVFGGSLLKKDPMLATGAVGGLVGSMKSDIEFLLKYPTLMKRIDEDEKNLMLANSQVLYQRKQNYEHDFKFQTLKLNKIAGAYQKSGISNRDAQEKYNKERGVSDVNVEVFLPSPTQQKQIDYIYETFGCECISDHFSYSPLSIRDNMQSGIYQFSRIESGGIQSSITDTTLREILRRILENGVKFQGCSFEIEPWETKPIHIVLPKRPKIVFDPGNIKDWSIEKWDTYKIKTDKKEIIDTLKQVPHFGLSDEEWDRHKDLFKDIKDDQIIDLINKIIADREVGETVIIALPKESDPEKEVLNKTIADLKDKIVKLEAEIVTGQQICDADKEKLNQEKQALQEQLNTCQKHIEDLTKAKADKEGEIGVIQDTVSALSLEKADLLKKLKECNDMIKRLRQMQATCDRVNTQKIKELEAQIKQCQQEKAECREQLTKVDDELTSNKQKLTQAQSELTQCNNNVTAKQSEIDTLKQQLQDKQNELDNRPTQQVLHDLKAEYEATKKRLEDEIHQHKVDKEDLTQQLNNERVRAINEKDEINRLKKQLEETKGDRDKITELEERIQELELENATSGDRIAEKHRELEQCRTELMLAREAQPKKEYKPQVADECTLWQSIVRDPYHYELKARENGWDAFLDLVFELAQVLTWEGRTDIDQKLFTMTEVRPILEKLEELKNIPIVDKTIDMMKTEGWPVFLEYLEKGGDLNGRIPKVVEKFNAIKMMETTPTVHAVKSLLDELNWLSFKVKGQLAEQLKTNEDLQTLYAHIYPGTKTLDLYKALYGDPKWAIIRKRFTEEFKCTGEGGGSMVEWADSYRNTTNYSTADIKKPEPKHKQPELPKEKTKPGEVQIRIKRNLVFKPTDNQPYRQLRNLIPNFNEAVRGEWTSERKYDYTWLIWNYVYERYIKSGSYVSGFKYKLAWFKQRVGSQEQSGRYLDVDTRTSASWSVSRSKDLWKDKDKQSVDIELNNIRSGVKPLNILFSTIPTFEYGTVNIKYTLTQDCIDDLSSLSLLEDFIRILKLLSGNTISWDTTYRDYSDNYLIYKYRVEGNYTWKPFIETSDGYVVTVGWLFPSERVYDGSYWRDINGNGYNSFGYDNNAVIYQFIKWFYEIATGSREFTHPWGIGAGGAHAFIYALSLIEQQ